MVKTREELLNSINTMLSENTSDEAIGFIEDISDTLNDYETRTSDTTDWKQKYEDNDKQWREKYRDRFFNNDVPPESEQEDENELKPILTFNDLFK